MVGKVSLMLVISFGSLLMILGLNLNTDATSAVSNMALYVESTESHELAVSGANTGLLLLYSDSSWRGPITRTFGQGSFTTRVTDNGSNLLLSSVSTYSGSDRQLHDTVRVRFAKIQLNSFTLFAWMTNFEGNTFWTTGDTVWGRMHSNGNIHIAGRPVFFGKTTTSKRFDPPRPGTGTNKAIFKLGYETGIAPISFPNTITDLMNGASSGGHLYTTEIWVQLRTDGMALIRMAAGGAPVDSIDINNSSFNGAIASTARVNVEGVLNGKLSIGSATDVRITGDVTYRDRTRDLLGLVAQNNVVIGNTPANANGVNVDACIFSNTG